MTLTPDNIESIKQFADKLEEWANNLSYSKSENKNFWVELVLFFYPQNLEDTVLKLANIPDKGQKIQKDFEELSKMIHKVDIWYMQSVCQDEFEEFSELIEKIKKVALNIVFSLRKIFSEDRSDHTGIKKTILEKSKSSELRVTEPGGKEYEKVTAKIPRKEALMAYHLHCEMGLTQSQVAKRITSELKPDKPVRAWEIMRWIKQVENWRIRRGFPVESVFKKTENPVL